MKNISCLLLASCILIFLHTSCKKDSFITSPDARVRLSADSVKFDTVFTTTGSVTRSFKIINENDQRLKLTRLKLAGGPASAFKININGIAGIEATNLDIAANDSIYVFVSVRVDPSLANLPFVIADSISIEYNSRQRWVQLEAYGQNARFMSAATISGNTTWTNDLPYVILGSLTVSPAATLTINPGTKIYSHANAPTIVDGSLVANGTALSPIIFTGDRLDEPYKNLPASWPGLIFRSASNNNLLRFTQIKNAYQAIVAIGPATGTNPKLILRQCHIDNAYSAGIFCSNSSVQAENLLISNSANNIFIESGGTYLFTHCTTASYSNNYILHKTPVLTVLNGAQNGNPGSQPLQAAFTNCIFWGDNGFIENEIAVNKQGTSSFSLTFDHCIYKAPSPPANATFIMSVQNQDPLFDSIDNNNRYYDFRQTRATNAPGVNKGKVTSVLIDLDNKPRNVGLPDMGCYEKQ